MRRIQEISPEDLLYWITNERPDLMVVLDRRYAVEAARPMIWVVKRERYEKTPDRFEVLTDPARIAAELEARGLYVAISPGGWIQLRKRAV